MTSTARKILEAALALPDPEREELVEVLVRSLSPEAVTLSAEWTDEVARRLDEIERGTVRAVAWADVEARIEQRLRHR